MDEVRYREAERRLWESFGLTPAERRVRLAGAGLTVRVQEVGQGPAVVLVHGTSNSGASWAGLVARLDGFRCVMLDRPGCGLSDPLGSSFDSMERLGTFADALIVDLLDAMGLDRAHLVATSFGGYIALRTRIPSATPASPSGSSSSFPTPSSSCCRAPAMPCGWTIPTAPPGPSGGS